MSKEQFQNPESENIIVSLEVAKLAQEKGYPGVRTKDIWFRLKGQKTFQCSPRTSIFAKGARGDKRFENMLEHYPAPTKSTVQRWLRTEHNIITGGSNPALLRGLEQVESVNQTVS